MPRKTLAFLAALLGAVPAALWIVRHEALILRCGRPLRERERAFAREIGIRDPGEVRIRVVPRLPSPMGGLFAPLENLFGFRLSRAAGVTLGYGIYVAAEHEDFALVAHELVHVRQYEALGGPLPFICRYFHQCLAVGYLEAPLEVEARRLSGE